MSEFKVRWVKNDEDYRIAADMLASWHGMYMPADYFSENGAIISKNGIDVCSGWLYKTDSKVCILEAICLNKKAPRELRKGCTDFLAHVLFEKAKNLGFKTVFSIGIQDEHEPKLHKYGFKNMGKRNFLVKYIK